MRPSYYWIPIPGLKLEEELPGTLIALEGTDGVGRTTQMRLLRHWLESSGLAVYDTGLTRGRLAGRHIQEAKEGHTMSRRTQALFYATDFADRLEREIVPALRAGYVVLTDRYIFSLMARAVVRGVEREWVRKLYGFALKPDLVLYMKISVPKLLPRVLASGGFDFWESGADFLREEDLHDAFVKYQGMLLEEFDRQAEEYGFTVIDADRPIKAVFEDLRRQVYSVVKQMTPGQPLLTDLQVPLIPSVEPSPEGGRSLADAIRDFFSSLLEDT